MISWGRYTRLYSSTEDDNRAMRAVFERLGAKHIGTLTDLNLSGQAERVYRLV